MRDRLAHFLINLMLRVGTREYREKMDQTYKVGRMVQELRANRERISRQQEHLDL